MVKQTPVSNKQNVLVGLTGGIGSGKSSVGSFLAAGLQAYHIDADQVCRELLKPEAAGWLAIKENFGPDLFCKDHTLNRSLLRSVIFRDEQVRLQINNALHPLVKEKIFKQINKLPQKKDPRTVIVEVPLLYEAGWEEMFDKIVVVYADCDNCSERLIERDEISPEEALAAICSQWPLIVKVMTGDHVIDNNGCWADTCLQMVHLQTIIKKGFGKTTRPFF